MEIQIIEQTENSIEMICGKKQAQFYRSTFTIGNGGYLNVLCKNAMHRAWRGFGNTFHGNDQWEQALNHYKSAAMISMIETARELIG